MNNQTVIKLVTTLRKLKDEGGDMIMNHPGVGAFDRMEIYEGGIPRGGFTLDRAIEVLLFFEPPKA